MNKILITIFLVSLTHCSFDNKTGIWKNDSEIGTKKISRFEDFETLYTQEKTFEEIILPSRKLKASLEVAQTTIQWADEFYNSSNKFKHNSC